MASIQSLPGGRRAAGGSFQHTRGNRGDAIGRTVFFGSTHAGAAGCAGREGGRPSLLYHEPRRPSGRPAQHSREGTMTHDLSGKTALVTGASRGLGRGDGPEAGRLRRAHGDQLFRQSAKGAGKSSRGYGRPAARPRRSGPTCATRRQVGALVDQVRGEIRAHRHSRPQRDGAAAVHQARGADVARLSGHAGVLRQKPACCWPRRWSAR